jgi:hypothetical protein
VRETRTAALTGSLPDDTLPAEQALFISGPGAGNAASGQHRDENRHPQLSPFLQNEIIDLVNSVKADIVIASD